MFSFYNPLFITVPILIYLDDMILIILLNIKYVNAEKQYLRMWMAI